jgi:hypothetical protein
MMTCAGTEVRNDLVLVRSEERAMIAAPIEEIDVASWLSTLPDAENQRCAPTNHLTDGPSATDDGRPMSITVEVVGQSVQHMTADLQATVSDHNRRETPLDAASIERKSAGRP